jgi:steroid 5-alpha reductase family enzyme
MNALASIAILIFATWLASVIRRDASLVDRVWGLGFVAIAWTVALRSTGSVDWWLVALVTLWGLRLSLHITVRNWGQGEDRRYQQMRARNGPAWWWQNLFTVFLLQGVLMAVVALPLVVAIPAPGSTSIRAAATAVWVIGFAFETLGDWQLMRFAADPTNRTRVLDSGVWRYTRHPNYFGETMLWWGFWGFALAGGAWWTVLSPIVVTVLLLRISGVPMLESGMAERRPGYRSYVERTSAFLPRRPRPESRHT